MTAALETAPPDETVARVQRLRRRLEALLGIPATEGNTLELLRNGDQIFPSMLGAIREATETIDFLTFVYWKGEIAHAFASALAERAGAGVRVRVLIDAIGGRLIDSTLIEQMTGSGVQVEWFRKPWAITPLKQNHRTHRKVLICDEVVGFTGGVGIAQEWCGDARDSSEWRDTHVRVQGPAVDGLSASFAQNWAETGHPLIDPRRSFPNHAPVEGGSIVQVARGSASVGWNDMATVFRLMMETADTRLQMQTAYFVPDPCFQQLMLDAVERGVEVDIMVPGPHADKRVCQLASESIYSTLVEGGVRVWAFQPSMLHAKVMTVDGIASVVGSANMNRRSMQLDEEVVLTILDPRIAACLEADFAADLLRCDRIEPRRWEDRPRHQKAQETATKVIHRFLSRRLPARQLAGSGADERPGGRLDGPAPTADVVAELAVGVDPDRLAADLDGPPAGVPHGLVLQVPARRQRRPEADPGDRSGGRGHDHVEQPVVGLRVRQQRRTAPDAATVADADHERAPAAVGQHPAVDLDPQLPTGRPQAGRDRPDRVGERTEARLEPPGVGRRVGADPHVHRVDHDPADVVDDEVQGARRAGQDDPGRGGGVQRQVQRSGQVVAGAERDEPEAHGLQLAPGPQAGHHQVQAAVTAGDHEGPAVQAVQGGVELLGRRCLDQLHGAGVGQDGSSGLDRLGVRTACLHAGHQHVPGLRRHVG